MKEIENKIKEFLEYSQKDNTNTGDGLAYWEKCKEKMKTQDKFIYELKLLAKENKTLLGRIITFQMADSSAMYIITKINKKSVRVTWVDYCDGHVDGRLGNVGSINMWYAKECVDNIDRIEKIFKERVTF